MTAERLPPPDAAGIATSRRLSARIADAIDAAGGWLDFSRFMQMALYEPGLGYYSAGAEKFGPAGDFATAPDFGDWFAEALAGFIADRFHQLGAASLLELGAGSGRLAEQLLRSLARRGFTDVDYRILETSGGLRDRQRARLSAAGLQASWLDALPAEPLRGLILGNEVADALPVSRFVKQGGVILPLGVARAGVADDALAIVPGAFDPALSAAVRDIETRLGAVLPEGYRSEVCLLLRPWVRELLDCVDAGGVLLIDYGLPGRDYYQAARTDGTLICHYRHRAHADPLLWPGLQDITAWVDFSAVADTALASGATLGGFTTQAQFLLASIAADPELLGREPDPAAASALKTLVLPGEMGERFKLIWLTRGLDDEGLPGRDFRDWL